MIKESKYYKSSNYIEKGTRYMCMYVSYGDVVKRVSNNIIIGSNIYYVIWLFWRSLGRWLWLAHIHIYTYIAYLFQYNYNAYIIKEMKL